VVRTSTMDLSTAITLTRLPTSKPPTPLIQSCLSLNFIWNSSWGVLAIIKMHGSLSRCSRESHRSISHIRASVVLLYLTGDKSKVVNVHQACTRKSPLSAVNDGVPRLEGPHVSSPLRDKGTKSNAKSSLSTPRHTRKYESADGLEFRLCRVRALGRPFRSHSATIDWRAPGW
jgi:hypothetical protein